MSCKTKLRQGDKVYCELITGKARFEDQFRLVEIFKHQRQQRPTPPSSQVAINERKTKKPEKKQLTTSSEIVVSDKALLTLLLLPACSFLLTRESIPRAIFPYLFDKQSLINLKR